MQRLNRLSAIAGRASFLGRIALGCAFVVQLCAYSNDAAAATHTVPAGTSSVECSSFNGGVRPGDTVVLAGRTRGQIALKGCRGTASAPIVVRNDVSESGPLVINQSGDGFLSTCTDCEYVVIDGTGKWDGAPSGTCGATVDEGRWSLGTTQCGIVFRCTGGSPQSSLRLRGSSKHVTVKGVEIDGNIPTCKTGIGLSVNDHNYAGKAGEWREGIRLLNNYVHDVEGEGMYVGPNQRHNSIGDLQLRDNEIAFNYVDRAGCDGINYKSAVAGQSSIHHNYVTNTGQTRRGKDSGCSGVGISLFEAGYTDIFSNYVEAPSPVSNGAGHCIAQVITNLPASRVAKVPVRIYNNVLRNCKGNGISFSRGSTASEPVPEVYNNTIVGPIGGKGINVSSSVRSCKIRDNIVTERDISAANCSVTNNSTAPAVSQGFRDAARRDFRLTAGSPGVDTGTGQCPNDDQIGTPRPQQGACDQGALEYSSQDAPAAAKPSPPAQLVVE